MGDHLGTPGAVDKEQSREHVSPTYRQQTLSIQALGKSELYSRQLGGNYCKVVPQSTVATRMDPTVWSHENGRILFFEVLSNLKLLPSNFPLVLFIDITRPSY